MQQLEVPNKENKLTKEYMYGKSLNEREVSNNYAPDQKNIGV